MSLSLTTCAEDVAKEKMWAEQLKRSLGGFGDIAVHSFRDGKEFGQIVFVDSSMSDLGRFVETIERRGRAVFLVVSETSGLPELWKEGRVDDVVVTPFRPLELLSKLRYYEQILLWNEVVELNASISDLLKKLQDDLQLTERLQKGKLPKRFPSVKGFKVVSRYFAGMKAGGDYFDLAESKDKAHLSMFLTHSTSYGLSNAVLSALLRVTMKLSLDKIGLDGATAEVVGRIYDELALTLGQEDQLSLFYGTISHQDRVLRFLNLGNAEVFYTGASGVQEDLPKQGPVISKSALFLGSEVKIQLGSEGRLVLVSYGFVEALGGKERVSETLLQFQEKDAADLLNELSFKMKATIKDDEEMPSRDCTVIVLDVEPHVLRLTKREQGEN